VAGFVVGPPAHGQHATALVLFQSNGAVEHDQVRIIEVLAEPFRRDERGRCFIGGEIRLRFRPPVGGC